MLSCQAVERGDHYHIAYEYGRNIYRRCIFEWIDELIDNYSPGEVLLTSVMFDGTMQGYDKKLVEKCQFLNKLPVIYSGGISSYDECMDLKRIGFQAVAISNMFHDLYDYCPLPLHLENQYVAYDNLKVCILDLGLVSIWS